MRSTVATAEIISAIACLTIKPAKQVPDLEEDVRHHLLRPPRSLPAKYFYLKARQTSRRGYFPAGMKWAA